MECCASRAWTLTRAPHPGSLAAVGAYAQMLCDLGRPADALPIFADALQNADDMAKSLDAGERDDISPEDKCRLPEDVRAPYAYYCAQFAGAFELLGRNDEAHDAYIRALSAKPKSVEALSGHAYFLQTVRKVRPVELSGAPGLSLRL